MLDGSEEFCDQFRRKEIHAYVALTVRSETEIDRNLEIYAEI